MGRTLFAIVAFLAAVALVYYVISPNIDLRGAQNSDSRPLNIDLQAIKPESWKPADKKGKGLIQISIDGDEASEWLFFYRDSNNAGQIGAVIYDAQNQPKGSQLEAPQQTPAYLIPYRLMPDYTPTKSAGYLGDDNTIYQTVFEGAPPPTPESDKKQPVQRGDFLQVRGYNRNYTNRVAVFWWLDAQRGYGGALAYTPGWFSESKDEPHAWPQWEQEDTSKRKLERTLWAWEPQTDRSNICRRVQWDLVGDSAQNTMQYVAHYEDSDLMFCAGKTPDEPTFPEAQVLAYLLDHKSERWLPGASPLVYHDVHVQHIDMPELSPNRTQTPVFVDFTSKEGVHHMVWMVTMLPPANLQDTIHWRIAAVYNQAP